MTQAVAGSLVAAAFLYAAAAKTRQFERFRSYLAFFGGAAGLIGAGVIAIEAAIAITIVIGLGVDSEHALRFVGGAAISFLLGVSAFLAARLATGDDSPCACFGGNPHSAELRLDRFFRPLWFAVRNASFAWAAAVAADEPWGVAVAAVGGVFLMFAVALLVNIARVRPRQRPIGDRVFIL